MISDGPKQPCFRPRDEPHAVISRPTGKINILAIYCKRAALLQRVLAAKYEYLSGWQYPNAYELPFWEHDRVYLSPTTKEPLEYHSIAY